MPVAGSPTGLLLSMTYPAARAAVDTSCPYFDSQVNFNLQGFSNLIYDNAVEMKYYQGTLCSCVGEGDGQPDPACTCYNGFRYPANPVTVNLMRTQVNYKGMPSQLAMILQGGCQITVPRCTKELDDNGDEYYKLNTVYDRVNMGDVFVIENRYRRERDVLKKGTQDRIKAFDVQSIISVSKRGTKYVEDLDYEYVSFDYPNPYFYVGINPDLDGMQLAKGYDVQGGEISWLDQGNSPSSGEFYTVEYSCKQQYMVYQDLAKDRGGDNDPLPKRLVCTLRNYVKFGTTPFDSLTI